MFSTNAEVAVCKLSFKLNILETIGAQEIDIFAMETRARRTLHTLVQDLNNQMTDEQAKRAEMEILYDKVLKRIHTLEQYQGQANGKPKIVIDLEN